LSHPDASALAKLESRLPRCEQCGGEFRYLNPLLCPHCAKPFIDFARHPEIRDNEYYGNYLYGTKPQAWEEANKSVDHYVSPAADGG
jgi:predicted amidophosphoribosyltransferase